MSQCFANSEKSSEETIITTDTLFAYKRVAYMYYSHKHLAAYTSFFLRTQLQPVAWLCAASILHISHTFNTHHVLVRLSTLFLTTGMSIKHTHDRPLPACYSYCFDDLSILLGDLLLKMASWFVFSLF